MNKWKWQTGFVKEPNNLPIRLSLSFDILWFWVRDNLNCFRVFNLCQ